MAHCSGELGDRVILKLKDLPSLPWRIGRSILFVGEVAYMYCGRIKEEDMFMFARVYPESA